MNLAGWLFIIWRRPFEVGDRIQIGNHAGDVIDQRIFQFTILEIGNWVDADQGTGRTIHIPNGKVFGEAQANYTKGFPYIWNEIAVLITFESNWKKAKNLLQEIDTQRAESFVEAAEQKLRKASRTVVIPQSGLTPMVSTSVKESGVRLTLRYLFDPRRRRESTNLLWEDILEAFGLCSDVAFAYPTQRFYDNLAEGKQGAQKLRIPVEKNTSLRDGS